MIHDLFGDFVLRWHTPIVLVRFSTGSTIVIDVHILYLYPEFLILPDEFLILPDSTRLQYPDSITTSTDHHTKKHFGALNGNHDLTAFQ